MKLFKLFMGLFKRTPKKDEHYYTSLMMEFMEDDEIDSTIREEFFAQEYEAKKEILDAYEAQL